MRRREFDPRFYETAPEGPETYEIGTVGQVTFHRDDFRRAVAETARSYIQEDGEARLPLFGYGTGNVDGAYDADETIMEIWWDTVEANLASAGANPLEGVMALFEEEGNAVIEDVKEELAIHVPRLLEEHGIPVEAEVGWDAAAYMQSEGPVSYAEGEEEPVRMEAGTSVKGLTGTSEELPDRTHVRGASSDERVGDVPVTEPLDEEEVTDQVGQRDSEAWDDN
ncbi:MAG: hypothetical protein SVW77_03990 [Candidatus Nanohaloarchaea archaeon]|nr:hypothetical protein [Candidatus Nanohaloarchaea archaeon]